MIINEQEYKIRKSQVQGFEQSLEEFPEYEKEHPDIDPRLLKAEKDTLQTLLTRLNFEIQEYEARVQSNSEISEANDKDVSTNEIEQLRKPVVVAIFKYQSQIDSVIKQLGDLDIPDKEITVTSYNYNNEKLFKSFCIIIDLSQNKGVWLLGGGLAGFWLGWLLGLQSLYPAGPDSPLWTLWLWVVGSSIVCAIISAILASSFSGSPTFKFKTTPVDLTFIDLKIPEDELNTYWNRKKAGDFLLAVKLIDGRVHRIRQVIKNAGGDKIMVVDSKSIFGKLKSILNKLTPIEIISR